MLKYRHLALLILTFACAVYGQELPKLDCGSSCEDEKIKAWYEKKYGEPITDLELSTEKIDFDFYIYKKFSWWELDKDSIYSLEAARNREGTNPTVFLLIQKNRSTPSFAHKAELSMEEWFDFIRALHKSRCYEWKRIISSVQPSAVGDPKWSLLISFDKKERFEAASDNKYPRNWDEFKKAIDDMKRKVEEKKLISRKETDSALSAAYQKRFGEPITVDELSIRKIDFKFIKRRIFSNFCHINASRDIKTGAWAELAIMKNIFPPPPESENFKLKYSIEEWLDFIHALHKSQFYEWKERDSKDKKMRNSPYRWKLEIDYEIIDETSDEPFKYKRLEFNDSSAYAPQKNWDAFKKAMDDLEMKLKSNVENR
jgi:hypothetical protein